MEAVSLSGLLGLVEMALSENFFDRTFHIVAETADIRNYKDRSYCFLKLIEKDETGIIANADAVLWKQAYHQISNFERQTGVKFDKNLEVLLEVSIEYSPKWGLRLHIHTIDPTFTLGKLELQRREVLKTLVDQYPAWVWEEDGMYHSKNQRLVVPGIVQKIALITAPASDGQRDFLHELLSNPFGYAFDVDEYLTQIQGNGAEKLILNQFRRVVDSGKKYDVVVLVRGGGSQTDFGPFDTLELGRAIAAFPYPMVTGIGHERNISIADLMAHTSVKTPTKAASFLLEINLAFESRLIGKGQKIRQEALELLQNAESILHRKLQSVSRWAELHSEKINNTLNQKELAIHHLNPLKVMERGYAIITKGGHRITAQNQIEAGDTLTLYTSQLKIQSKVDTIEKLRYYE